MKIEANTVVAIDYTLTDDDGQVIDTSQGREPLTYLHGHQHIVPGLENALEGLEAGEHVDVAVSPEEGYGPVHEGLIQAVPRSAFGDIEKIEVGMQFQAQAEGGAMTVTVKAVDDDSVTVDGNHQLAGQTLNFAVDVQSVRAATAMEMENSQVNAND